MNENYNNYKQHTNIGFRIVSIFTIVLNAYMVITHFYDFSNAIFFDTIARIPTGQVPLDESYYRETAKYPVRDFIYGTLFLITFVWAIISTVRKTVRSLSICLVSTFMLCVVTFLINEILTF